MLLCTFADNKKPQALKAAQELNIPASHHCKFNNSAVFPDVACDENDEYEYDIDD